MSGPSWTIHLGDCLDPVTGMASLGDKSVDHVIADPPYGKRTHDGQRSGRRGEGYNDSWVTAAGLGYDHLTPEDVAKLSAEYVRVARGWILLMTSHDLFPAWEAALGRYQFAPVPIVMEGMNVRLAGDGPSSWTVWLVVNRPTGLKGGTRPGAYVGPPGAGPERGANIVKGAKPEWLLERLVRDYTKPGDMILDSHSGGGTTGVAAIRHARRFVGWEVKPEHHAIAVKRLTAAREQLELCA